MMSDELETKLCTNCKREILAANFVIHTVHCQRNLSLCSKCQEAVPRSQLAEHEQEQHVTVSCTNCYTKLDKYQLTSHLANDCPFRKVPCSVCELQVRANELSEHENYCGARTEKCSECGEYVMFKYKQLHLDSNHTFLKLTDEPGPSPSWQFGRRTLGNFLTDLPITSSNLSVNQRKKTNLYKNIKLSQGDDGDENVLQDGEEEEERNKKVMEKPSKRMLSNAKVDAVLRQNDRLRETAVNSSTGAISKQKKTSAENVNVNIPQDSVKTKKSTRHMFSKREQAENDPPVSKLQNKRNNDQPQLNKHSEKEINDICERDRLLALQLAEDDNKSIMIKAVMEDLKLSYKPNISDDLLTNVIDEFVSSTENTSANRQQPVVTSEDYSLNDDEFLLYDKLDDMDSEVTSLRDVRLPCEFCNNLYPSDELILHETGCKGKSPVDMTELPCEFCDSLIPVFSLSSHQMVCDLKTNSRRLHNNIGSSTFIKKINNNDKERNLSPQVRKRLNKTMRDTGLQNGIDNNTGHSDRMGTRSQLLHNSNDTTSETNGALPRRQTSRKSRRAPSPPSRM